MYCKRQLTPMELGSKSDVVTPGGLFVLVGCIHNTNSNDDKLAMAAKTRKRPNPNGLFWAIGGGNICLFFVVRSVKSIEQSKTIFF